MNVLACSCDGRIGIVRNKKTTDYVFKGRVKKANEIVTSDSIPMTKYTFEILRNYKGLKGKDVVYFVSGVTSCDVYFEKGNEYIVYAYNYHGKLDYQKTETYITTHLCTRTKKKTRWTFWESFVLWLT